MMAEPSDGSSVFVDAVVMYHHLVSTGEEDAVNRACTAFLQRCEEGALTAHTCATALAEAVHKLMATEACLREGWPRGGAVARLRRHPDRLASLAAHTRVVPVMRALGIRCHDTRVADVERAATLSAQYGLLTNDAIIVATMQRLDVQWLATNDDDFARVPWLKLWKPSDP